MPSWWNSLHVISYLSWIARGAGVLSTALIFIFGWREFTLGKLEREAEKKQAAREKQGADLKIGSLAVEAETLKRDTANAQKEIAVAQAQAAQANEKAEAERLRRRQLEASFEPRAMSLENGDLRDLRLFPNTNAIVSCAGADAETRGLSIALIQHLEMVGWKVVPGPTYPTEYMTGGVLILSRRPDTKVPSKYNDAAQMLQFLLNDSGIEATAFVTKDKEDVPDDNTVTVRIGAKPPRYFESRQLQEWLDQSGPTSIDPNSQEARSRSTMKKLSDPEENLKYHLRYDPGERERIVKKYSATK